MSYRLSRWKSACWAASASFTSTASSYPKPVSIAHWTSGRKSSQATKSGRRAQASLIVKGSASDTGRGPTSDSGWTVGRHWTSTSTLR
ncbi:hypothetical protein PF001_g32707 [Phytophthora fragariae]|uniref:Uncharacterized protein n=1 Tax=Phytophthora fragariae TaxID=53985 RepID=A0A6A4AP62_9STRA|nr:hypothetical protein PF001_g32707 [Phytophthora fragariae]